jgi:Zn-dependent membrane protease YugP
MNVPVLEYQSIVQFAGGVAERIAEVTLLQVVTLPPEFGAEGRGLTVIEIGAVTGHCV